MWCWFMSDEASNLATVVTCITTVAALLIAWWQFSSWKKQQTSLKKSEVAGRFYVAVSNLMEAIKTLTSPFSFEPFDEMNELSRDEAHIKRVIRKQEMVQEYVKSFNDNRSEAEVYLDYQLIKAAEELWQLYAEIHLRLFVEFPEAMKYGRADEEKEHRKFIYTESKDQLAAFETSLREPLKEIARMEQKKNKSTKPKKMGTQK